MDPNRQQANETGLDFYEEAMIAIQTWCLKWMQLQEKSLLLTFGGVNSVFETGKPQQQSAQLIPAKSITSHQDELESLSVVLKEIWVKHFDDEKEVPRRRKLQKQQSISALEETGVGCHDHLNGLSLEQLQAMEKMVYEHDSGSCYGSNYSERSRNPLGWIDSICT